MPLPPVGAPADTGGGTGGGMPVPFFGQNSGVPFDSGRYAGQTLFGSILSTASGGAGAAAQIFTSPSQRRNGIVIINCDAADPLYVGFTSDVSATKFYAKVAFGESITIMCLPQVKVYLFSSGTTDYCAHEVGFVAG